MRSPGFLPVVLAGWLSACTVSTGGRTEACGEYPAGGGPAVIVTRDQELCEVVRLRVMKQLDGATGLNRNKLDTLIDKSLSWEMKRTIESLLAAVRKDAGDATADALQRAIDSVAATSTRTTREDCGEVETCLTKGAAKGLRLALMYAQPTPEPAAPKEEGDAPKK